VVSFCSEPEIVVLKGHGFSRAENAADIFWGL
jgi:hypothetical protein